MPIEVIEFLRVLATNSGVIFGSEEESRPIDVRNELVEL